MMQVTQNKGSVHTLLDTSARPLVANRSAAPSSMGVAISFLDAAERLPRQAGALQRARRVLEGT
jgi:hypothetical protein